MNNKNDLTAMQVEVLKILFFYRGLSCHQLSAFYHKLNPLKSFLEKSMYNTIKKLINMGFVKYRKMDQLQNNKALYYLSPIGLEIVKEIFNIDIGQSGNGILPLSNKTTFWDIPYEYQVPPLKQLNHYILSIEFFKQLIVNDFDEFEHITSLYANLDYYKSRIKMKVRPDALVLLDDRNYAIEIDCGTESNKQLTEKFTRYKELLAYEDCHDVERSIDGIIFVVASRKKHYGLKRRWVNILSAFYKAFGEKFPPINLIMVPLDEVPATLNFLNMKGLWQNDLLVKKTDGNIIYNLSDDNNLKYILEDDGYTRCFIGLHLAYESAALQEIYDFYKTHIVDSQRKQMILKQSNGQKEINEYNGYITSLYSLFRKPIWPTGIENNLTDTNFISKLKKAIPVFEKYMVFPEKRK